MQQRALNDEVRDLTSITHEHTCENRAKFPEYFRRNDCRVNAHVLGTVTEVIGNLTRVRDICSSTAYMAMTVKNMIATKQRYEVTDTSCLHSPALSAAMGLRDQQVADAQVAMPTKPCARDEQPLYMAAAD